MPLKGHPGRNCWSVSQERSLCSAACRTWPPCWLLRLLAGRRGQEEWSSWRRARPARPVERHHAQVRPAVPANQHRQQRRSRLVPVNPDDQLELALSCWRQPDRALSGAQSAALDAPAATPTSIQVAAPAARSSATTSGSIPTNPPRQPAPAPTASCSTCSSVPRALLVGAARAGGRDRHTYRLACIDSGELGRFITARTKP